MAVIKVEAHLPSDELIKALEQLDAAEFERFVAQVIALQARRRAPSLSQAEAQPLQRINQGLPADLQRRYDELIARRQAGELMAEEHQEPLRLTERVEGLQAQRVEDLAVLARLRGSSFAQVMADLGIAPAGRHG